MAFILRQFDTPKEAVDYLNDVVQGKPLGVKVAGLHNKTLILTPVGTVRTVTFADASGEGLSPTEIVAQIEATNGELVGTVALRSYRPTVPPTYRLTFHSDGDLVDKDGTANAILGFDTAADATVGANAVAIADIVTFSADEGGNKFTVVHQ
jgi:hypothetical protein